MLHLIDPSWRAMSTGMVPCQRKDWWAHEIRISCAKFWRLPRAVFNAIIEGVDGWPISLEEGEKTRKEFVEEREGFRVRHTRPMEGYQQWDFGEDIDDEDEEWDSCGSSVDQSEGTLTQCPHPE